MDRQPHRIVVEGMDGAGKTTLIEQLSNDFPQFQVITRPQGRSFNDWWPEELDRLAGEPIPIYDRFFYSELVYGPILRHKIDADTVILNEVAWFLRSTALLIYCRPHSDTIRKMVLHRPQMDGVIENFDKLLDGYDAVMAAESPRYGNRFHQYDWHGRDAYDEIRWRVKDYLDK